MAFQLNAMMAARADGLRQREDQQGGECTNGNSYGYDDGNCSDDRDADEPDYKQETCERQGTKDDGIGELGMRFGPRGDFLNDRFEVFCQRIEQGQEVVADDGSHRRHLVAELGESCAGSACGCRSYAADGILERFQNDGISTGVVAYLRHVLDHRNGGRREIDVPLTDELVQPGDGVGQGVREHPGRVREVGAHLCCKVGGHVRDGLVRILQLGVAHNKGFG